MHNKGERMKAKIAGVITCLQKSNFQNIINIQSLFNFEYKEVKQIANLSTAGKETSFIHTTE